MIFEQLETYRHEQVVFGYLHDTGLKAIIAIHDTTLGPALGGCRMYPYASEEEAVEDVLRLARGMTYKAAASGLNLGGGKAVIIGDPKKHKSEMLFRAFGKLVDSLGGRYITAEDVGTNVYDMEFISHETPYVTGVDITRGGSGDPSPFTAFGVLQGQKASLQKVYGSTSLAGRSVAVQGIGHVGVHLVEFLLKEGATVFAADLDTERTEKLKERLPGVEIVSPDEVLFLDVDIVAPCAMGGVVDDDSIDKFRCKIIAGAANNQLRRSEHGQQLKERGILYAPDYVINAGGLMNVYQEFEGYSRERAFRIVRNIRDSTMRIFQIADSEGISTNQASDRVAVERMHKMGRLAVCFNRYPRSGGLQGARQAYRVAAGENTVFPTLD